MALCGIGLSPGMEGLELGVLTANSSTRLIRSVSTRLVRKSTNLVPPGRSRKVGCLAAVKALLPVDSQENAPMSGSVSDEQEFGHVMKFNLSDFTIYDRISLGLGGRADELVFEAMVKDSQSPLLNTRVVLRQLTSAQAKRRGRRAIEVLRKLACRRLMYHSYSLQVHGYVTSPIVGDCGSLTLVHGCYGSYSLRHWLQQSDWLPTLEATLALDEEAARKVGDDTIGGPAVTRELRIIRILMRDLLIGVNYLHSHGLAHTELRLENVHVSPVDGHIKVGILGNAADFHASDQNISTLESSTERRQMMIAFDMRCVGFMMAKMVLRELMDPFFFMEFKSFLTKGNDPSCLREFLLQTLHGNSSLGNAGLQILDRNWGAGWNLLSLLLANKPSGRIRCLDALRHPFLCGPRWRVEPSIDIIRWGLGSTAVRITEEYIYNQHQRRRLAHFIELLEMLNPYSKPKNWLELLPGKWRLLYSTGTHIGLTLRQPSTRVLIGDVRLTVLRPSKLNTTLSLFSDIGFTIMVGQRWPLDKVGVTGKMQIQSLFRITAGRRLYLEGENAAVKFFSAPSTSQRSIDQKPYGKRSRRAISMKDFPSSLPVAKLRSNEIEVSMSLGDPLGQNVEAARDIVQEIRTQIPPEMFDLSRIVCGTYVDSRLLILRGVSGSALMFTRSCANDSR